MYSYSDWESVIRMRTPKRFSGRMPHVDVYYVDNCSKAAECPGRSRPSPPALRRVGRRTVSRQAKPADIGIVFLRTGDDSGIGIMASDRPFHHGRAPAPKRREPGLQEYAVARQHRRLLRGSRDRLRPRPRGDSWAFSHIALLQKSRWRPRRTRGLYPGILHGSLQDLGHDKARKITALDASNS